MLTNDLYITIASMIVTGLTAIVILAGLIRSPRSGFRRIVFSIAMFSILIGLSETEHLMIGLGHTYHYEIIEFALILAAFIVLAYTANRMVKYNQTYGFNQSEFLKKLKE